MTIHSIDSMPQGKPLLVAMRLCDDILKEYYGSEIFYYVCINRYGEITEASGEEYATFSDNDKIELLGWVSFDELNKLFNIKGEQK